MGKNRNFGAITAVHASTIIKGLLALLILLMLIFSVSGMLTSLKPEYRISSDSVNTVTNHFTGKMLFSLLANENHYFFEALPEGNETEPLSKQILKLSANISLDDPRSLLGRELPGFSIFDSKILVAGEGTNYTNMPFESAPPLDVLFAEKEAALQNLGQVETPVEEQPETPVPQMTTNGRKVVHIYFTHTRESFLPYLKGVKNPDHAQHSVINVTKLGDRLVQSLDSKGVGAAVDKTDVMTVLNQKKLKYPRAYQASRSLVQTAMATNQDIEYLIDIHRDAQRKDKTTIRINGQSFAKIAFVVGGENKNYEKNLSLANKLHTALGEKYPGLSRGIFEFRGEKKNGVYNQDLSENAMLIEIGGVDNTFEEMNLTIDAFAGVFSEFYWQTKAVDANGSKAEAK